MITQMFHRMITNNICLQANCNHVSQEEVFLINALLQQTPIDIWHLAVHNFFRSLHRKDTHLFNGHLITLIFNSKKFQLTRACKDNSEKKTFNSFDIEKKLLFKEDINVHKYYRHEMYQLIQADLNEGEEQQLNVGDYALPWHPNLIEGKQHQQ